MSQSPYAAGLGEPEALLRVYIGNRPPLPHYDQLDHIHALRPGEVADIVAKTGNHWRKVFNLYAKLAFFLESGSVEAWSGKNCGTWQDYRDNVLLQPESRQALLFSAPDRSAHAIHIIMGKQHAQTLAVSKYFDDWVFINPDFSISRQGRIVLCPYFDYRQLSNQKLDLLVQLVSAL